MLQSRYMILGMCKNLISTFGTKINLLMLVIGTAGAVKWRYLLQFSKIIASINKVD